ncbi:hypothetical protein [Lactococcus protaetiae]|uniref:Uncharacterized protein n=1 Tax=Lactococcus protaetiae TaxID=2592653 RepID=A0A514ZA45_9LACT|nr:hypothetical protein [Lactococcus protaetiae]QDK71449.1 hypothetical protein FLP15_10115 [Lactococcus protaetiae]
MTEIVSALISVSIASVISIFVLKIQLRDERMAFLSFEGEYTKIVNIGDYTALNISLYRVRPELDKNVKITLLTNYLVLKKGEELSLSEKFQPNGHFDYYILQFLSLNGKYYHQIYKIEKGRGDIAELQIPIKISDKHKLPTYYFEDKSYILSNDTKKLKKFRDI